MENSRIEYQLEYAVWEMTHGCNMSVNIVVFMCATVFG